LLSNTRHKASANGSELPERLKDSAGEYPVPNPFISFRTLRPSAR